jgi:hypothetical protein
LLGPEKSPASEGGRYKAFLSYRWSGHQQLSRGEIAEGGEEAVDFFGGVVVDQADAEHAAL